MARFEDAIGFVLENEGGFQRNPKDKGNYWQGQLLGTNRGISAPVAREWGYTGRMEDLDDETARQIYQEKFWRFDGIANQAVATKVFDLAVNMGHGIAVVQRAVNTLVDPPTAVDNAYGPDTEASINAADPAALLDALKAEAEAHYRAIVDADPSQAGFLPGWLTRAMRSPSLVAGGSAALILVAVALGAWYLLRGRA